MKAIVQDTYGSTDTLALREIDQPVPGRGQVLVRVRAAGVDYGVWHLMTGRPYAVRAGFGLRRPKVPVRGRDLAGHVEAVGADVTRFAPGDEVMGTAEGTFAEFTCARQDRLVAKPAALTFEQAAALPISGLTALHGVHREGRVQAGQRVLVIGAAGGVGSHAVQLAKAAGAQVTGMCRTSKVDLVRSLGADDVLDYTTDPFPDAGDYDVILDIGGNRPLRVLRRALAPGGTLVIIGGENGGRLLGGMGRPLGAVLRSPFTRQRLRMLLSLEKQADLETLAGLAQEGKVTPAVERTFPLAQAADAIRHLAQGRARGKVVVTI
jgi:NADPH:quinone reductase-like Zn-dependent oxidoreductase